MESGASDLESETMGAGGCPAWRRQQEVLEAHAALVPRLQEQMAGVDAGLAQWVGGGVRPPGSQRWCPSFCGRSLPSQGGVDLSAAPVGFPGTYVAAYSVGLLAVLVGIQDMAVPLATGLALMHHRR